MTIEMPPLQFAETNGIRMGYYEAGPKTDQPPMILCHGWPELAFSWRHQIKALSAAGIRVIAPDQRGYGSTDRPEPVEAYDIEHLTGDLIGLMDHLGIDKAIFVGHDWGGFVVWQMPLRHLDRVAGVVGVNTPHSARPPVDPIDIMRKRFGDSMYIVQFQDPAREPDRIFNGRVEQMFDAFMRKPLPRKDDAPKGQSGVPADDRSLRCQKRYADADPVSGGEKGFVDSFTRSGFTGGINWYRNMSRNWRRAAELDSYRAGAVADDHGRERRRAAAVRGRRHGETGARPRKISGAGQRPLDPAGKTRRGQRQADRMA